MLAILVFVSGLSITRKSECLKSDDKILCDSDICNAEYKWCELCDKCLYVHDAMFKEEL